MVLDDMELIWPVEDLLCLVDMLQARGASAVAATSRSHWRNLRPLLGAVRRAGDSASLSAEPSLQLQQALLSIEHLLSKEANRANQGLSAASMTWKAASDTLQTLEGTLHTEMRYIYWPDWELKPGKLVSKKGTWLKHTTQFSWQLPESEKYYLPLGIVMPVLQIGRVVDQEELGRHDWSIQHLRIWLKPSIMRSLEARRGSWFIYWPHWEDHGNIIIAGADTWLKRTTQMSGDLQPFELIYVPQGLQVRLAKQAENVEEEWEKYRHQHVHLHRKIALAAPPVTVTKDKYDIFVGQDAGDERGVGKLG